MFLNEYKNFRFVFTKLTDYGNIIMTKQNLINLQLAYVMIKTYAYFIIRRLW